MNDDNNQPPVVDIDDDTTNGDSKFIPTHLDDFEIEGEEDNDDDAELTSVNTFDILDGKEDEEEETKPKAKDMTVNPFTDEKIEKKTKKRKKGKFLKILKKILILLITLIVVCAILFGVYWFFIKDNEDFNKKEENTTTEIEVEDENETNDTTNTVEVISGFKPKAVANTKKYEDRVMEQLMSLKQITTVMISKGDKEYQFRLLGNTLFVNTDYRIYAYGNKGGQAINVDHTDIKVTINGHEMTTLRNKSLEKIVQIDNNYLIFIVKKPNSNNVYDNLFVDNSGSIVKTIESNRPSTVAELVNGYTFTVNTGVMGEITSLTFYKNGCNKVMKYDLSYDSLTGSIGHEDVSETEFEIDGDKTGC